MSLHWPTRFECFRHSFSRQSMSRSKVFTENIFRKKKTIHIIKSRAIILANTYIISMLRYRQQNAPKISHTHVKFIEKKIISHTRIIFYTITTRVVRVERVLRVTGIVHLLLRPPECQFFKSLVQLEKLALWGTKQQVNDACHAQHTLDSDNDSRCVRVEMRQKMMRRHVQGSKLDMCMAYFRCILFPVSQHRYYVSVS